MSNVPRNKVKRPKGLQTEGDFRSPTTSRKLNTAGRKNRNMGASAKGRQHGRGFPTNQV
jgi:hypothetical protein